MLYFICFYFTGVAGTDASGGRPNSTPGSEPPHQRRHLQDMQIQDVSSSGQCRESLFFCQPSYDQAILKSHI